MQTQSRHLAAILFTDIVGYTALMQHDESMAVATTRHYIGVLKQYLKKHQGRLLNDYGDGSLCVFPSAMEALRCAIGIQEQLQNEPKVPLRIGLHIGEIFFEQGKVFGDGVNVASRIQSLGLGNTILFSKEILNKIKNHPEFTWVSLGFFDFKNVDEPMEVFALSSKGLVVPNREELKGKLKELPPTNSWTNKWKWGVLVLIGILILVSFFIFFPIKRPSSSGSEKSIALLPFENMSNDSTQQYFVDGMMDEILNHLYKIGGWRVVSRTTTMAYRGTKKNIKEIAKDLNVNDILEGSVQRVGDKVSIRVQLIDGNTDEHLWAETYQRDLKDVFTIQSDIAQQIASNLKIKIDPNTKKRIEHIPTENMEAYNYVLQAESDLLLSKGSSRTLELLNQAIALDSGFADAYAWLGLYWINQAGYNGNLPPEVVKKKAEPLIQKALRMDPDLAIAHIANFFLELWFNWNFKAVEQEYEKVLQLNPSNAHYILVFSMFLNATGRYHEALQISLNAFKKDKNIPDTWLSLATSYFYCNEPDKAEEIINTAASLFSTDDVFWFYLKIKVYLEKYKDVVIFFENAESSLKPSLAPTILAYIGIAYYKTGQKEKTEYALEILKAKQAKSPVGCPSFSIATIYTAMGKYDLAIQWLEQALKDHEAYMIWLKVEPLFRQLHNDPRFQDILKRIGFS